MLHYLKGHSSPRWDKKTFVIVFESYLSPTLWIHLLKTSIQMWNTRALWKRSPLLMSLHAGRTSMDDDFSPKWRRSDLLSVGTWHQMSYQQDWQLLRGGWEERWGVVQGEMSFRLCEVANYLQDTLCRHGVSALAHSPTRGDLNAA